MGDKVRKFTVELYLMGFLYTLIIFGSGFIFGYVYNQFLFESIKNKTYELWGRSVMMELLFTTEEELFCPIYFSLIDKIEEETWKLGQKLEFMEREGKFNPELKERYFEIETRDYLLERKAARLCDLNLTFILYFYTNNDEKCKKCLQQGYELDKARKEMNKDRKILRIYSYDGEYGIGKVLARYYNVTKYPSLIINGKKYEGFLRKEEIISILNNAKELKQ